jgi:nitroreductase
MERIADHEIDPQFLKRWSPRAMNGKPIEQEDLMRLFEAARWAPSSRNEQPWRFLYARQGTPDFPRFLNLLAEGNRPWCEKAGALIVVLSKKDLSDGKPAPTHSFDAGSSWMSLALQASFMGIVAHGMAGFDRDRTVVDLKVPSNYQPEAMLAVGYPGTLEDLPERYRAREVISGRRPITESVFEGNFPGSAGGQ